jgi:divalent metal cation (Fe/Co/Zn/Cd) transporter
MIDDLTTARDRDPAALLHRGRILEWITLSWNAVGIVVLATEGRVTLVDGIPAVAVLLGLILNAVAGLWWADPLAALVIVIYGLREARAIFLPS